MKNIVTNFCYVTYFVFVLFQIYKMADEDGKIKLFESDEESEEEEDIHDDFKIRPEYQGPHGLQVCNLIQFSVVYFKFELLVIKMIFVK